MNGPDRLTSLPKKLPTTFLLFSITFFLSPARLFFFSPEASPSLLYLLPVLLSIFFLSSMATFVNTSGHHRNTSSHGLASGHGRVSGHGRISHLHYGCMSRLRPWSHLASLAMLSSPSWCVCLHLDCVWFSPFFPLLFCLNLDLNHFFFFQILWFLEFIVVVQWVYMFHVLSLTVLFSLVLKLRKSIFYCLDSCYVSKTYFFNC